ncbi:MAG: serine/threonine-protein kinase [Myxococcota bacterium]
MTDGEDPRLEATASGLGGPQELDDELRNAFEASRYPGSSIDRYQILQELGAGGFGVVWRAWDPRLERTIAIKLLHDRIGQDERAAQRLRREAMAAASVSHPNVVSIYDVGVHEQRVFIAMELVEGGTLSRWAKGEPPLPEILEVFEQVAAGLAAVHEAGFIHRDLKPGNLMRQPSGRVLVMDFGLARISNREDDLSPRLGVNLDELGEHELDGRSSLTSDGVVMGSPPYMAPEQLTTGEVGPRSDQYAFCVALYELLMGRRPHVDKNLRWLARAKLRQPIDFGNGRFRLPRRLIELLRVGMAPEAAKRHPTMDVVRDELRRIRARLPWRRRLLGAGVALTVVAGISFVGLDARTQRRCDLRDASTAAMWNDEARAQVRDGFSQSGLTYAADTASRVVPMVDERTRRWEQAYEAVCTGHAQADDAAPGLERQLRCLNRARSRMAETLGRFREADVGTIRSAIEQVSSWPDVARCEDAERLRDGAPRDPSQEYLALESRVEAWMEKSMDTEEQGASEGSIEAARKALELAQSGDHPTLQARARLRLGQAFLGAGKPREAREHLSEAAYQAQRHGAHHTAATAAIALVFVAGTDLDDTPAAEQWARHAEASLAELTDSRSLRAKLEGNLAVVYAVNDDIERALPHFQRSLDETIEADGPASLSAGVCHFNLSLCYQGLNKLDDAASHLQRAMELLDVAVGRQHPRYAQVESAYALLLMFQGNNGLALDEMNGAMEVLRETVGEGHPTFARSQGTRAAILVQLGRLSEAERDFTQALEAYAPVMGEEHPDYAMLLGDRGDVYRRQGDAERALVQVQRGLRILERGTESNVKTVRRLLAYKVWALLDLGRLEEAAETLEAVEETLDEGVGTAPTGDAPVHRLRGALLQRTGKLDEAHDELERGLRRAEKEWGREHRNLIELLLELGIVELESGRVDEAATHLERALALTEGGNSGLVLRGRALFGVARVHEARDNSAHAAQLARQALDALLRGVDRHSEDVAAIDRWLEAIAGH